MVQPHDVQGVSVMFDAALEGLITTALASARWRKAQASSASGCCLEACAIGGHVLVRDSKQASSPARGPQPVIPLSRAGFAQLLSAAPGVGDGSWTHPELSVSRDGDAVVLSSPYRDTTLTYTRREWSAFVSGVEAGEFTHLAG